MSVAPVGGRPTAQARAEEALRAAILAGELRPGQRVNQETWAERAGVSQIPVREALGSLAGEGLVTYRPRRGYVVTELDLDELEEVYALRRLLETRALRAGVPRVAPGDITALRRAADECRGATHPATRLAANRRFHSVLHGLAGSRPLSRVIDLLWDQTEAYRALYYALPGEADHADAAHRAIVDAVRRQDVRRVVELQDAHRDRALSLLRTTLAA